MEKAAKYQSIQLLRALAAIMVLIFHSKVAIWPREQRETLVWIPGFSDFGDLGVSLFFVISGFIIANVVSKSDFTIRDYIWRRFWRIYPLYWLVTCSGLFMLWKRNWFRAEFEEIGSWGIIKGFLIVPQKAFPFWNPGWTLEHEVLFYAIAAVVAPLLGLRFLAGLLFAMAIIGMTFNLPWDFHLFADPQLYFAAGILAYLAVGASWRRAIPLAASLLAYSYACYYGAIPMPVQITEFAFALGAAALIVALLDIEANGWRVPKVAVAVGDASYSLYLWHWMVIPCVTTIRDHVGGTAELWRWIVIISSVSVALLSYRLIEKPLIGFAHRTSIRYSLRETSRST